MAKKNDVSLPIYIGLITLTLLSMASYYMGFGRSLAVAAALSIAVVKACTIAFYYMHVKDEPPIVYAIIFVGLAAVFILAVGIFPDLALRL